MKKLLLIIGLCLLPFTHTAFAQSIRGGRTIDPNQIFTNLDKNRDGKITVEEIPDNRPGLKSSFSMIDRDSSGALSVEELGAVLQRAQQRSNQQGMSSSNETPSPTSNANSQTLPTELAATKLPPARYTPQHLEFKFHDSALGRDIPVTITYPKETESFPVIVFSPNLAGSNEGYQRLHNTWVAQGYVVISPHPSAQSSSAESGQEALSHWRERPEDMQAVINALGSLQKNESLRGKFNLDAIGVGGHLIGAMASSFLVGATTTTGDTFKDKRVKAALLMAPQGRGQILDDRSWENISTPMMVLTGSEIPSKRTGNPAIWRTEPFEYSDSEDGYLVYIQNMDGRFGGLFPVGVSQYDGAVSPQLESYALKASIDFWNAFLKNDVAAKSRLDEQVLMKESGGIAQLRTRNSLLDTSPLSNSVDNEILAQITVENDELFDAKRQRTLPIRIYAPKTLTDTEFPTVVFTHGLGEGRDSYHYLGEALAKHGYNALFISHPGSDSESFKKTGYAGLNTVDNAQEKAEDLHFVITLLTTDTIDNDLLTHRVDPDRIAVGGQCAGTSMAALMGGLKVMLPGNQLFQSPDPDVKVIFFLGPQVPNELSQFQRGVGGGEGMDMLKKNSWEDISLPVLVVAGERDFMWSETMRQHPRYRVIAYDGIGSKEKYLVDLKGAAHHAFTDSQPWYPGGPRNPMHHPWISEAVVAFLDGYLKNDDNAVAWLQSKALQTESQGGLSQEFSSQKKVTATSTYPNPATTVSLDTAASNSISSYYKAAEGPYSFKAVPQLVLHDSKRDKDLQLRVTYPIGQTSEKFPVILFSHGAWGTKDNYEPLIEHWASHGYVVLQMNHADSRALGTKPQDTSVFKDWADRPADITLTIDSLANIEKQIPDIAGHLDLEHIGVGGHSYGAHTAQLIGGTLMNGAKSLKDSRVDAILMMSPQGKGQSLDESSWKPFVLPMMVITGSNDIGRNAEGVSWRLDPFRYVASKEKFLLFINGAYHDFGNITGRNSRGGIAVEDNPNFIRYVLSTSTAFWDTYLKNSDDAKNFLYSTAINTLSKGEAILTHNAQDVDVILKAAPAPQIDRAHARSE